MRLNILDVLNSIESLLSNQCKEKTLSDAEILSLRQEYDRIYFHEFEDIADEWGYLLNKIGVIERKIAKGEYE